MGVSSAASRPGKTFFAPDVRICLLADDLTAQPESGTELQGARLDLISLEVTRVNTGPSQYSLTLNNPPKDGSAGSHAGPFRYNDFATLNFGKRLRFDFRYWPDAPGSTTEPVQAAHRWVPMISGPITDMKFTFTTEGGAQLTVIGQDDLYPLKNKSLERVSYHKKTEEFIIKDVLSTRAKYPLPLKDPEIDWPGFFTDDSKGISETLQKGQSYLEFLQKIASRYDCEVFVEFDDLASPSPKVGFYFEPARCRVPLDENSQHLYVLSWGKNLLEFTPAFQVLDQYTEVTVEGRHRIRSRPELVRGPAAPQVLQPELVTAPGETALVSGPEIRERLFRNFGPNPYELTNQTNIDPERAAEMARTILRQKAREFLKITGTTIGLPHLRPGVYVQISNMKPPFDGFYYVERTVSRFGKRGFTTQFSARRPGMPLPQS